MTPTRTPQAARTDNPTAAADALTGYKWEPQPEAERLVREWVEAFLRSSPLAQRLRDRLHAEAGVRFVDLVDTLLLDVGPDVETRLLQAGFQKRGAGTAFDADDYPHYAHPGGLFPRIEPVSDAQRQVALRVESIADFVSVWQTQCDFMCDESPLAKARVAKIEASGAHDFWIVERHGYRGMDFPVAGEAPPAEKVLHHSERFRMRPREWGEQRSFSAAPDRIDAAIADLGVDYACDLFFAAERDYWQRRNRAAQIQKARQDRVGIGWANHDHHTYRSSRRHFARLIAIFEKLGFHCRERFYAGKEAGWGAQVLEQPNAGIVIFADVDLSPDELMIDFAHEPLPERDRLGTVGLWCALHGESFLEAGMHHLECQFDFSALKQQLESEAGVKVMKPFTDFPYLRQAFTEGERWPVRPERIDRLLKEGLITQEQAEKFRREGAIGSHLENLERNQGFKGFNQTGVSEIISATDPRKH